MRKKLYLILQSHFSKRKDKNYPSLFSGQKYPKKHMVKSDGYTVEVSFLGSWKDFTFGVAQRGDAKGSVRISGNGIHVRVGNRFDPLNLSKGDIDQVQSEIESKYNRNVDRSVLKPLLLSAFSPYSNS